MIHLMLLVMTIMTITTMMIILLTTQSYFKLYENTDCWQKQISLEIDSVLLQIVRCDQGHLF